MFNLNNIFMSKLRTFFKHVQVALQDASVLDESPNLDDLFTQSAVTKKEMVLKAVCDRARAIMYEDLPWVENDLMAYFDEYKNTDYFQDLSSEDYYRFLDLRDRPDVRVVVVGDIHCDYYSLAALLLKLSVSEYDYFENAYFVFLGDYLDRGAAVFEPLLLLMDLKKILGDRMIMLRGNHELISYNEEKQELESRVIPQDTCPVLNDCCRESKEFLKSFGYFYKTLPTYVYLKVADQNILLTHAAVPRQLFFDNFRYDQDTGAIVFETRFLYEQHNDARKQTSDDSLTSMTMLLNNNLLKVRNKILYDMIWGDPCIDKEKYQVLGRFQFGSTQFEAYAQKNNLSRVFRSHEPVENGFESFFDNRLYTVFSTGGSQNDQAGYFDINPAFAVVKGDGNYFLENSFIYDVGLCDTIELVCNLFSGEFLNRKASGKCAINDEFFCPEDVALQIEALFAKVRNGFFVPDEPEEERDAQTDTTVTDQLEQSPESDQESESESNEAPITII